ncbi:nitroreductase family protein [Companilactobacillus mishanensis]|uniref:Nitroreductase family protein n=1 Tax=Companilactobacillus mishanensis TaxID=2486008 RepID=A0A5P0ZK19_9LACO|nr:nitroreductase family protein [Companilactobacillus mishanensis]MQS53440.1 nitroreductase family protein [Companilactobacillus mishanensis]
MENLNMIKSRRAIRKYSGQINDEQLEKILMAANAAPVSLGSYDEYRLTVIQDPKVLSQISGIYDAPTFIVVSAQNPNSSQYVSAGAIVHNMELAAQDQGLGSNYNMGSMRSVPTEVLPNGFSAVFGLTVGQTTEKFTPREIPMDRIKTNIVK